MSFINLLLSKIKIIPASCVLLIMGTFHANAQSAIPHLEKRGAATQLVVNGQPYLILGGELLNSSTSSAAYMKPIWTKLKAMHLNTALAAVSWELVEPEEGKFDFSLVDSMIMGARNNNLHLVLLWFGTWKNGLSHYTPAWVKKDFKRFPRMHIKDNKAVESITPLSEAAMNADAKAFAALMKYVKQKDGETHTVIMIQVENEVGLIGGPRDRGELANKLYGQPVPVALMNNIEKNKEKLLSEMQQLWGANGYKTTGTWPQVFGDGPAAEEAFMGWQYARYINKVAEAGKAEYPLPMYVNAWIVQPEDAGPGDYPSGGPQAHMLDIWRAGAPNIDLLSPDIYLPGFDSVTASFTRSANTLFVPESRGSEIGAANAFYAIGKHSAVGYSPFGIDRGNDSVVAKAYAVLEQLTPEILTAQNKGSIRAVWLNPNQSKELITIGGYKADISLRYNIKTPTNLPTTGYGIIIETAPNEFTIAGKDIQINFYPATPGPAYVGLASVDEGVYVNGKWIAGRRLNGDDIMQNYHLSEEAANQRTGSVVRLRGDAPGIVKVKLYRFE